MKIVIGIIILMIGVIVFSSPETVQAGPPTATYPPPRPTATSASLFLRPTPTPLDLSFPTPFIAINVGGSAGPMADQAINAYRAANSRHIIDFLIFGLVVFFGLMMLVRNIGQTTRNK